MTTFSSSRTCTAAFSTLRHQKSPTAQADFILSPVLLFGCCCTTEATTTRRNINAPDRAAKRTCISFFKNFIVTRQSWTARWWKDEEEVAAGNGKDIFLTKKGEEITCYSVATESVTVAYGTRQFIINDCSARYRVRRVRRRASDSTFLPPPSQQLPTPTFSFFSCRDKWFSTLYRHPLAWYF